MMMHGPGPGMGGGRSGGMGGGPHGGGFGGPHGGYGYGGHPGPMGPPPRRWGCGCGSLISGLIALFMIMSLFSCVMW